VKIPDSLVEALANVHEPFAADHEDPRVTEIENAIISAVNSNMAGLDQLLKEAVLERGNLRV